MTTKKAEEILRVAFKLYYKTRIQIMKDLIKNNKSFKGINWEQKLGSCYDSFIYNSKEKLVRYIQNAMHTETYINWLFVFEPRQELRDDIPDSHIHTFCWNIVHCLYKYSESRNTLRFL